MPARPSRPEPLSAAGASLRSSWLVAGSGALGALLCLAVATPGEGAKPKETDSANAAGVSGALNLAGKTDPSHPFFQSLGTNNRSCFSCHDPAAGGTITPSLIGPRFDATQGLDPLFRPVDGSVSPNADVSTVDARRQAYKLLLQRGLIRVGLPIPSGAEFTLDAVDDPYGFASAAELSLFRRSLPAVNLPYLSTVMWDGRETHSGFTLAQNLASQASGATTGHAQATAAPSDAVLAQIVKFELGLFQAQVRDAKAGTLTGAGTKGGPDFLARVNFYPGMNNPFQPDPRGKVFNPDVFQLYKGWDLPAKKNDSAMVAARKAIGRGERIFNQRQFNVSNVAGLNDALGKPVIKVGCSTCHNMPSVGNFTLNSLMDLGVGTFSPTLPKDLPLYTLRNTATGETRTLTDPGRALITGKWADVAKFKVPGLRGLAARAPYFHDGSAATLEEVIDFYDRRFGVGFTPQERSDLAAFLRAL